MITPLIYSSTDCNRNGITIYNNLYQRHTIFLYNILFYILWNLFVYWKYMSYLLLFSYIFIHLQATSYKLQKLFDDRAIAIYVTY